MNAYDANLDLIGAQITRLKQGIRQVKLLQNQWTVEVEFINKVIEVEFQTETTTGTESSKTMLKYENILNQLIEAQEMG